MTENQEAEILAKWLKSNNYLSTHIANESWLPPRVAMIAAKRKQRMWLTKGFPDYCIILKRGSLLFIELKKTRTRKKNGEFRALSSDGIVVSPEQEIWKWEFNKIENVQCEICYWADEAINFIKNIDAETY